MVREEIADPAADSRFVVVSVAMSGSIVRWGEDSAGRVSEASTTFS